VINFSSSATFLQQCQRYCVQNAMLNLCDCLNPYLANEGSALLANSANLTSCTVQPVPEGSPKRSQQTCVSNAYQSFDEGNETCPACRVPCSEDVYETTVTHSMWPSGNYAV